MPFASSLDLCKLGVAAVGEDGAFYVREIFVQETLIDFFSNHADAELQAAFRGAVDDLEVVLRARGVSASGKGDFFENVVFQALRKFNGTAVLELPFVKLDDASRADLSASAVWGGVKLVCTGASGLNGAPDAATFLLANPTTLLSPEVSHRADGVLLLGDRGVLEVGCKFYSSTVPTTEVRSQFRATNPACAYELANAFGNPSSADRFNANATAPRKAWADAGFDRRVGLRINICVPNAATPSDKDVDAREHEAGTHVDDDGESILVNLDATNIHLLFGRPAMSVGVVAPQPGRGEGVQTRRRVAAATATAAAPKPTPTDDDVLRALYRVLWEVTRNQAFDSKG